MNLSHYNLLCSDTDIHKTLSTGQESTGFACAPLTTKHCLKKGLVAKQGDIKQMDTTT